MQIRLQLQKQHPRIIYHQQRQPKYIEQPIKTVDGELHMKKYQKLRLVGEGSYSKCYLVKTSNSDSTYVIKIIPKKKLQILQKQKLIYQIKIHQSLSHSNVVHLDHWFEDQNYQYLFLEYCSRGNLQQKVQHNQCLQQKDIKKYVKQITLAISYIHSQNILHRDLKLCNFYFDENNNVKLGDFGFACKLANDNDKKRQTCGTPNYIAPEAISGYGYSYSSDVWSIGVILFRLKFGYCPFEGQTVKRTLQNVKLCSYKFPSKIKISSQLKDLIQKILTINYDQRLTTQQILIHKFFDQNQNVSASILPQHLQKQQKKGFSLTRLFTRQKDHKKIKKNNRQQSSNKRQNILERQSRNQTLSQKKQQLPKRSNSCQTFKQIKQIFKNKSKNNLTNTAQPQQQSSPYYTLNTFSNINPPINTVNTTSILAAKTLSSNRTSIMQYSYNGQYNPTSQNSVNKKQKDLQIRSNRLNQFIKSQVNTISLKQQLKVKKNMSLNQKCYPNTISIEIQKNDKIKKQNQLQINPNKNYNKTSNINSNTINNNNTIKNPLLISHKSLLTNLQQQLYNYSRRYYLPNSLQQQKDIIIIHFKTPIKFVIYSNQAYIIHRSIENLYKATGESVSISQMPKVLKYVIENKIQIKDIFAEEQYQYIDNNNNENNIKNALKKLPQSWNILKDGIILKYGNCNNVLVSKLHAQQGYFVIDDTNQSFMYILDNNGNQKLLQGIVTIRIYNGWVKTYNKK